MISRKDTILKIIKTLALPALLYLIFLAAAPTRFGTLNGIYIIFLQTFIPVVIGFGLSFGFIAGIFDFTVGSRIIISALIGGTLASHYGLAGLVVGCILTSVVLAIFSGAVYRLARIPSLVVSFGLVMIFEILGAKFAGKDSLLTLPAQLSILGSAPYNIIIAVIAFILFFGIFYFTRFSYQTRIVGNDEIIAKNMGINVQRVKFLTYVVGGLFLGLAAILQISYSGSIAPQVNLASMMTVFRPMIGLLIGMALMPVCNLAVGIFVGTFSINIIFTGIIALGLPDTMQNVVLGVFLLAVMAISAKKDSIQKLMKKKSPVAAA